MTERGILFKGEMVRAILECRKTQTRRIVKPQPVWQPEWGTASGKAGAWLYGADPERTRDRWSVPLDAETRKSACTREAYGWGVGAGCPYGVAGDRLWVRETWCPGSGLAAVDSPDIVMAPAGAALAPGILYAADGATIPCRWRPSIHMPRRASRITLQVTGLRIEQLWDITEEDAKAEGVRHFKEAMLCLSPEQPILGCGGTFGESPYRGSYAVLWDEINGDRVPWSANPWVWVVEFRALKGPEGG